MPPGDPHLDSVLAEADQPVAEGDPLPDDVIQELDRRLDNPGESIPWPVVRAHLVELMHAAAARRRR